MKQRFIELLKATNRSGILELITFLDKETDFFTAPASTNYHGACEAGLLIHSLEVYNALVKIQTSFALGLEKNSVIICGLLHDICKANFYKRAYRNRKNDASGLWERVDAYEIEDQFPVGHGEKSVIILQEYIKLYQEEVMAIRWHMGGFDDSAKTYTGAKCLSTAMGRSPLVTALHMADLSATYFYNK